MIFSNTNVFERQKLQEIQGAVKASEQLLEKNQIVNKTLALRYMYYSIKMLMELTERLENEQKNEKCY